MKQDLLELSGESLAKMAECTPQPTAQMGGHVDQPAAIHPSNGTAHMAPVVPSDEHKNGMQSPDPVVDGSQMGAPVLDSNPPIPHTPSALTAVNTAGTPPMVSQAPPVTTPMSAAISPSVALSTGGSLMSNASPGATISQLSSSPPPSRRTRFKWLPDYEQTVFASFLESVRLGYQGESTMRGEAWIRALDAMRREHGITLHKRQIVSKFDNTKSKYRTWCILKKTPGFSFDSRTRRVMAHTEIWDKYLLDHPEAACFRTAPLEHEDALHEIYSRVAFHTPQRPNSAFAIMQVQPQQSSPGANAAAMTAAAAAVAASDAADHLTSPSQSRSTSLAQPFRVARASLNSSGLSPPSAVLARAGVDGDGSVAGSPISPSLAENRMDFSSTRWVEKAVTLFCNIYAKEPADVQLKAMDLFNQIGTAISFCKMESHVREAWVQQIRTDAGYPATEEMPTTAEGGNSEVVDMAASAGALSPTPVSNENSAFARMT